MRDLLAAGIRRTLLTPIFWITVVASVIIGAFFGTVMRKDHHLDAAYLIFMQAVYAVLISFFVGREWEEGGFRTKIVRGHTRWRVLLAELFLSLLQTAVLTLLSALTCAVVCGVTWTADAFDFGMRCILCLLFLCPVSTLIDFTLAILLPWRAIAVVMSLSLVVGMALATDALRRDLNQPEQTRSVTSVFNEETGHYERTYGPWEDNPQYVGGVRRKVYTFLLYLLPSGQGDLCVSLLNAVLWTDLPQENLAGKDQTVLSVGAWYSTGFSLALVACAGTAFCKRDLK